MGAFVVYLLKSSLLLALLVSLFLLFMSRETFHKVNRYVMLFIVVLSLALPFVNIGIGTPLGNLLTDLENAYTEKVSVQAVEDESAVTELADEPLPSDFLLQDIDTTLPVGFYVADDELVTREAKEVVTITEVPLWMWIPVAIYMLGVAVLLVWLLVVYLQVAKVISRGKRADAAAYGFSGIRLRVHNGEEMPFSWFRWVVVSEKDLAEGAREVLAHETAHVKAGHSWDILLIDAVAILQWFNPLVWIMKNSLKDIHEFEADEAVIASGVNAKQYQLLIIKKAVGARLYSIANSFNHSLTKKRITMMCKEKSKKWRCAKALYIVPVAAAAALSFSSVENANAESASKVNEFVANETNSSVGKSEQVCEVDHICDASPEVVNDDPERIYQVVEVQPEFPGGMKSMMRFLQDNIRYPEEAAKVGKQGRAFVQFVVMADGTLNDVVIMKSTGTQSLDDEAVRVVKSMPKWNPGKQGGKAVNVRFTLPVNFKQNAVIELPGGAVAVDRNMDAVVVIDGEIYKGDINNIDSNTIESITVVKAEQLTEEDIEKYGAQGKQGVIFIETKNVIKNVAFAYKHEELNGNEVYQVVEQQPEFPGGLNELMAYLRSNINYPQLARDLDAQGKVYVSFVVTADGSIDRVRVLNDEVSTCYQPATDQLSLEKHLIYYERHIEENKAEVEYMNRELERLKREYEILEKDGAASSVLERRKDEIKNVERGISSIEGALRYWTHELDQVRAHLEKPKKELDEVAVVAYKNGKVSDASPEKLYELNKAAIQSLRDESVRVVKSMPKWNPGKQGSKEVNVEMTLPITFRLK